MAGETVITVVGNLTADPELRTTSNGGKVVNFTIASTPRTYNRNTGQFEDGDALFMRCSCWDSQYTTMASNIAQSLTKGMRVIAQGNLVQRSYQTQQGESRTVVELRITEIGPSLSRATASVNRISSGNSGSNGNYSSNRGGFQGANAAPNYANGAGANAANANYNAAAAPSTDPWSASDDSSAFGGSSDFGSSADFGSEEIPF
ncbi:single-stranded DNA-binding protein [Alloscardovia theropitheci]|uniref:Single-stranded DNA-binding protein n=1 Tax=Alloscardovia theropitheci TaxID=2496842 RepID=A0A4R0QX76_9BIFI|nr:single-stranded DNA-binding protein [Alloscardovia theropitheci]TCD54150.1 single-stranded DNA-binding protein [Alloscardovia theropitheci]